MGDSRPATRQPRRAARALATFSMTLAAPAMLGAQQIRGVVRDSSAQAALPGVVVSLLDSAGASVGRTIADGSGRFAVMRSPRAMRLHAVRIGYRPRDIALTPSMRDTVIDIAMAHIPPMLEAVQVSGRELCPGSADRGPAFQLWEQARAGLLAAVVARDAKPANASTLLYDRYMLPNDDLVRRQTQRVRAGRTTRPFVASASPATFARRGYMIDDPAGRLFSAPDADVLLDESFAATHCFHLQGADGDHADQIGLAFVPVASGGRDTLVDVSGVIWIARATPELRALDFKFTQLEPVAMRAGVGGHLEFHTAPNGVSFIKWWYMRLPMLRPAPRSGRVSSGFPSATVRRQDRTDVDLAEIFETGGIVLGVKWDDGTTWQDPPTGIAGTIAEKGSGRPATRAIAAIDGASDTVTTNGQGAFSLAPLAPGKYTIVFADTGLQAYTEPRRQTRQVTVPRGAMVSLHAEVPAIADVISMVCDDHHQRRQSSTTTIAGRIMQQGEPLARDAKVQARWQADFETVGSGVNIVNGEQESTVDEHGRFIVCGVALDRPVRLHVALGTRGADTTVVPRDTLLVNVDWSPRLRAVFTQPVTLDTVRTRADENPYTSSRLRDFEERRRNRGNVGTFIDASVLRPRDGMPLSDVLRPLLPGATIRTVRIREHIAEFAASHVPPSGLLSTPSGGRGSGAALPPACYLTVYLDGVLLYDAGSGGSDPPDLSQFSVSSLAAVEYYASSGVTPARFKGSSCGTLLLWTREK